MNEAQQMENMEQMTLWFALHQLQERYVHALDNDRLEEWPEFFTDDCLYEIIPRENADAGLPIGIIYCDSKKMLHDRVLSLRHANIYEAHTYRHMTSGLVFTQNADGSVDAQSSYVVVQTLQNGESFVYQAGRYEDRVVKTDAGWRYARRRVIYDTLRVATLLATPI
ncbi:MULTISPECIES: anthranilate 1,2-dioxygenase small subunit AndAd [Herbaspirillum]|uniref:Anthranilate dioxygenase small subunit n=1 Tax=Herbaspirillum frisingense GSF30 TaxID=864073 RepID=A0AAI9N2X4_9BURK|nr:MULTISPECIES: anthranilate 1,2-dioxygenase small subunit AndAd [Herbaspirillum]EOA03848.1 anthranilate dioxygenase small subunit [Herbaspirillum frisingense GSF30]MCI1013945.1 aromatic-ring-hydroxylating dioxygenase subunit beta [Herbaspirillum sp. C7C2]ONN67641.1 anthranilate 1,2-dioxygenase [Herbaspirillum sp. VT-16-41]